MSDAMTRARRVLAEALQVPLQEIDDDASIDTVAGWDSLAHMRVVLEVEAALGHELDPEAVLAITRVENIARILDRGARGALR